MRLLRSLLVSMPVAIVAACGTAPPSSPASPPPPLPPVLAVWTPLDAPPPSSRMGVVVRFGDRELRLDESHTRWLYRPGAEPVRSARFEAEPLASIALLPRGVVAVTTGGRVLRAADDVAPFEPAGEIPAGADARSLAVHRGGLTIRASRGVALLRVPEREGALSVTWLPPFEGRQALDARIGADCAGLVVFSPQRLAVTRDCGQSYKPIDDRGVHAASLLADGDRIVLEPGGEHDVFARALAPGAEKLERSLRPSSHDQPFAAIGPVAHSDPDKDVQRAIDTGTTLRTSIADHIAKNWRSPLAVRDGDRVFVVSSLTDIGSGTLGGGFTFFDRRKRWPACKHGDAGFAACGGRRVLACGNAVHVFGDGDKDAAGLDLAPMLDRKTTTNVALQGPHHLFFTSLDGLYRFDLRASSPPVLVARVPAGKKLRARCDEGGRAPVWIGNNRVISAERAWSEPGEPGALIDLSSSVSPDREVIGMARDGALLVRDPQSGALALLNEDGRVEVRALPGAAGAKLALAFNDDGQGLAIERETGRAFQSLDAGATWTPTRGPGRPIGGAGIFCTATRCEVDGLFLRRGWDESAPAIDAAGEGARAPAAPVVMPFADCEPAAASSPRLPQGVSASDVLPAFGPRGALWAAMAVTSGKEGDDWGAGGPSTRHALSMLVGLSDGSVQKTPAAAWTGPRATTASLVLVREGALFVWMDARGIDRNTVSAQPSALGAFAADGRSPPRRQRMDLGEVAYAAGEFALAATPFATDRGVAVLETRRREVLWLDARGKVTARPWPDDPMVERYEGEEPYHALAARADGAWIGLQTGRAWARVVVVAADGVAETRLMARAEMREQGAGILARGADVDVAMVERDESGAVALRVHRVGGDLGLGPPRTIPGTQAAEGAPVPLGSCAGAELPGAMDLSVPVVVQIDGGPVPSTLVRRVRFDAARACAERSMVVSDKDLRVVTQGALDGPGVLARAGALRGAACRLRAPQ